MGALQQSLPQTSSVPVLGDPQGSLLSTHHGKNAQVRLLYLAVNVFRTKKHTPKFANLPTPSPFYQRAHTKKLRSFTHCVHLSRRSLGYFNQLTTYVRLLGR